MCACMHVTCACVRACLGIKAIVSVDDTKYLLFRNYAHSYMIVKHIIIPCVARTCDRYWYRQFELAIMF